MSNPDVSLFSIIKIVVYIYHCCVFLKAQPVILVANQLLNNRLVWCVNNIIKFS